MKSLATRIASSKHAGSPLPYLSATIPSLEPVFQRIFERQLAEVMVPNTFYPVGGAANYGLLYLITRIVVELNPRSILDVGAGQSSILLARLLEQGRTERVVTVDDNQAWSDHVRAQVGHPVLRLPLSPRAVDGQQIDTYDWAEVKKSGPYNLIVCDGPRGTPRFSRYGIVELVDSTLPQDFVLIMDDVERAGEQDTMKAVMRKLDGLGRRYTHGYLKAHKNQGLVAGGSMERAVFFAESKNLQALA